MNIVFSDYPLYFFLGSVLMSIFLALTLLSIVRITLLVVFGVLAIFWGVVCLRKGLLQNYFRDIKRLTNG